MWRIAADSDIAAAYAYGWTPTCRTRQGRAVVTDANILAAVEAIVAADTRSNVMADTTTVRRCRTRRVGRQTTPHPDMQALAERLDEAPASSR